MAAKLTYTDLHEQIEEALNKRKGRWRLNSIKYMDWCDVKQELRIHIHKKFHLWDQERHFGRWVNKLITNQIKNKIRNNYTNYAPPCAGCEFNEGGGMCSYEKCKGIQCSACPLYREWEQNKRPAHELNMAQEFDYHENTNFQSEEEIDYDHFLEKMKDVVRERLNPVGYRIYVLIFVEHKTDEEVAKILKYKTGSDPKRSAGYRQIIGYRKQIKEIIKEQLFNEEMAFADLYRPEKPKDSQNENESVSTS